MINWIGST